MSERHDERSRIARNALSAYGTRFLIAVSALVLTPYLYRRLGAAGFGTWSVMLTLMMVSELVETGFSTGLIKHVSEFRGLGRRRDLDTTVGVGIFLMATVGIAVAALAAATGLFLPGLAATSERHDFRIGMLVLAGAILIRYPTAACLATLKGYQRYDLSNATDALLFVGFTIGAVVGVEAGLGVLGVAIAWAVSLALAGALAYVMLHRVDPQLPLVPNRASRGERGRILNFSSFALLAESMLFIGQRMDVVVIAAVRNAATAAPYAAALKLQSGVQALTLPFVRLLMPMASELWARGQRAEVARRVTIATRVALQITLPVAAAGALFAHDIVRLWFGTAAPPVTATIIVILMAVQTMTLSASPAETVLVGVGRVRVIGALSLVEGLSNIGLTIVLVHAYGALGAALGTLLTSAVLAPVRFPLVARALETPLGPLLRSSVGAAAVSSLPAVAAMAAVWALLPQSTVRFLVGGAVGVGIATAVGALQVGPRRIVRLVRSRGREPAPALAAASPVGSDLPVELG